MILHPLLILTEDFWAANHITDELEGERIRQIALLKIFFADITNEGRDHLSNGSREEPANYLHWKGIVFRNGGVNRVEYHGKSIGNFNIHALPPSTKNIIITLCHQKYSVETRMLPKALEDLSLYRNEIFGTIDLTNLPNAFEGLSARWNHICGPINLTKLPNSIRIINLSHNRIDQKVVLYANIPSNLQTVDLANQDLWTGGVHGIQAVNEEEKLDDWQATRIFPGMNHFQ